MQRLFLLFLSPLVRVFPYGITSPRINDNLQQQMWAVFNKFFVEPSTFPDGWHVGRLTDIADYTNGLAMQRFRPLDGEIGIPVLKIKELRQGFCDADSELCSPKLDPKYLVDDGDVIFSWSGSLLVDIWCGGRCGLNQHLFKVTSNYDKWFYYLWTLYHLDRFIKIAADKATTMGHIQRGDLVQSRVIIPNSSDLERIGEFISPILSQIVNSRLENNHLATLRDTLLPKLMSGEIDVSEVEF